MKASLVFFSLLLPSALLSSIAMAEEKKAADIKPAATAAAPASAKPDSASAKDYVVINLDGEEIKNSELMEIWKGLFQGEAPEFNETIRQSVLRGLISERLIYKEAIKSGFDKNEDIKKRIESLQKQVIMQGFVESKVKSMVTDDKVKGLYDEKLAANKGQEELKASHILVATEAEAKKLSDSLKKGGDFAKTAKEKSTDKGSGANGGDLGWFGKDKMVPEFFEAAFKLKKGEVSVPVKTGFGWHVIKLEDRRPLQMASFEESKEALGRELSNKIAQGYVEGLLKAASIKYFDENGKEKDFPRTLAQPETVEKK